MKKVLKYTLYFTIIFPIIGLCAGIFITNLGFMIVKYKNKISLTQETEFLFKSMAGKEIDSTKRYKALIYMNNKYGCPSVTIANNLPWYIRGNYVEIVNCIYINAKKATDQDILVDIYLDELAHVKQSNDGPFLNRFKYLLEKLIIIGEIMVSQSYNAFLDNYEIPGSSEYEAHKVIAPQLKAEYEALICK